MDHRLVQILTATLATIVITTAAPSDTLRLIHGIEKRSAPSDKNLCPQGENPGFVIYADPDECGHFFTCVHGTNVRQPCAPGLRFSNPNRVCAFPGSLEDTCGNADDNIIFPNVSQSPINPIQTTTVNPRAAKNEGPQGESPEPYLYADPEDCTKYFHCSNGVNILRPCPSGLHFNTERQACVHRGSDGYQCEEDIIRRAIRRCQEGYQEVTPHPFICQRYFDCSDNSLHLLFNSPFLPYEGECEYPQVFDSLSGQCMSHKTATCSGISKAGTYVCDYLFNQCRGLHCIPCTVAPSCVGLPDGDNFHTGKPGSPYYVRCEDGYTVEELFCAAEYGVTMVFSQDERRCVPYNQ